MYVHTREISCRIVSQMLPTSPFVVSLRGSVCVAQVTREQELDGRDRSLIVGELLGGLDTREEETDDAGGRVVVEREVCVLSLFKDISHDFTPLFMCD